MSFNQIKRLVRDNLPKPILNRIQSFRAKRKGEHPRVTAMRKQFEEWHKKMPENQIKMREGMVWNIHPESRYPFSWFCYQSHLMVEEFDLFLKLRQPYSRFLDIGANHGVYSLAFCSGRPNVEAVAIDPSPLAFPILSENIRLNPSFHIRPYQVAAGDSNGQLRMKINWHHLEVIADQTHEESDQIKIVPVRKIDDHCAEINYQPQMIKVDVEGFELQCLKGMVKTLETTRSPVLLEIHPELIRELHYTPVDVTNLMTDLKYQFRTLEDEPISASEVSDRITVNWVICMPK